MADNQQAIQEALLALYRESGGLLTRRTVVDAAASPEHVLHSHFEWDDAEAADRHRLAQAGELIRSAKIHVRSATSGERVRLNSWVSVPTADERQRGYRPTEEVAADPLMSRIILAEAERQWRSLQVKYGHMAEFVEMVRRDLDSEVA